MRHKQAMIAVGAVAAAVLLAPVLDGAAHGALADTNVFTNLNNKAQDLFYNSRTVILIVCALAIVGTMLTAITGRFPVTRAFAIMGAIVVIGMASQIVTYFAGQTNANTGGNDSSKWQMTDTSQGSSN